MAAVTTKVRRSVPRAAHAPYALGVTPAVLVLFINAATEPAPSAATEPVPEPPATISAPTKQPNIVVPAVHSLALMTVARAVETALWPDPFARTQWFGARYEEAFTQPPLFDSKKPFMRWDGDSLLINVGLHGLFGSELYLRARQCRLGWGGALAFAAATSAVWEYGFEANGVRPSAQDLVYTPLMGIALGELRFVLHRAAGNLQGSTARGVVRGVLDPFGELERAAGSDC
jgi:hypothetical protein